MTDRRLNDVPASTSTASGGNSGETRDEHFRRRVFNTIITTTTVVVLLIVFAFTFNVLLQVFLSILIAVVLRGFTNGLKHRTGWPDQIAFGVVLALIVAVFILLGLLLGPQLSNQITQFVEALPQAGEAVTNQLRGTTIGRAILQQAPEAVNLERLFQGSGPQNVVAQATGLFSTTLGLLANTVIVIFLGIYFAIEPQTYLGSLMRLIPPLRRPRARDIADQVTVMLQRWLLARALSMVSVGVLSFIGLVLIGAPLALTLAIINGLFSFIPTFGPLIGAIPAALLALLEGPQKALLVLVVFFVVQQIDNYLFTPIIERRTASLPPALTLSSQLFLSVFSGVIGLIVAAPLAAATLVLVREAYVEDVLGDKVDEEHGQAEKQEDGG
ncbi:MAG: AI-2E family transporter [bacterium]|nr:AI-2E family transporter [bacterium]